MKIRQILCIVIILALAIAASACGTVASPPPDYASAEAFEADLNAGKDLTGKTVSFVAAELNPQTLLGYNVMAGEHLNFISDTNPGVSSGDLVTVKVTEVRSLLGAWIIAYEKISVVPGTGASSSSGTAQSANTGGTVVATPMPTEQPMPLEIADHGMCAEPPSMGSDTVYLHYCSMIKNPNDTLIADSPKVNVTIKNGSGAVLATDSQTGFYVMPGDTITLIGMTAIPLSYITDDASINFNVSCSGFSSKDRGGLRSTDFEISNISELPGGFQNLITGEVTNLSSGEVDMVQLSLVLRKNGEIVYLETSYVDDLIPNVPQAFEFQRFSAWPEHDSIEISAQYW